MEPIGKVLSSLGLPNHSMKPEGTVSRPFTRTPKADYDFEERFKQIQEEIARRREIMERAPVVNKTIHDPKECPWKDDYFRKCEDCKDGQRIVERWEPKPHRVIYDVSACFKEVRYRELIQKSGLVGIELEHTFEAALIDEHNRVVYRRLMEWDPTQGRGIYISADKSPDNPQGNGTGKSYALHALTHRLCRMGIRCLYARTVDFLMELRAAYDENTQESEWRVLDRYIHVPVLLWDDLGKESFRTEWGPERFYYVIDARVRLDKPVVISSNFDLPEIEERFGIDNFGPAIASRLAGFCKFLKLGGPDRRFRLRRVK